MLTADAASRASKAKAVAEEEMRKTIMILVGDIVHDLRTPITAIKTTVDFLHRILPQLIELAKESKSSSNLLSENSWDYLQNALEQIALNGSGKIIISTRKEEHFNIISIKDTAGGAPAEYISQFFNGYFTTKTNGTGIGLAFCKKTMLSFGGDIQCLSVEGESMEFILKFPSLI